MNQDTRKNELWIKYEELTKNFDKPTLKKYNLYTVKNYIIHFNEISDTDKKEVYDSIQTYLLVVKETGYVISSSETIDLFNHSLSKLMAYYGRIGFISKLSYRSFIFILFVVFPILFLMQCRLLWYFALLLILLAQYVRIYLKTRQNKVFGPGY